MDLQTLQIVNSKFRRLSQDTYLRRQILYKNKARINSLLFNIPQRPSRTDLVLNNILRGPAIERKIKEGSYVASPVMVHAYDASCEIKKDMTLKAVAKSLEFRPGLKELRLLGYASLIL